MKIVARANTDDELNNLEKSIIAIFKRHYGKNCYNIAIGGEGGNTIKYMSSQQRECFISKMSIINKERCSSKSFKDSQSNRLKELYKNKEERIKVSKRSKYLWTTKEYREKINRSKQKYIMSEKYILDRKKRSIYMHEYWQNENNKVSMSNKQKMIWTDEKRKQHGELLRNKFKDNNSLREKHSNSSKKLWKNKEYREKMINCAKDNNLSKYGSEARKVKLKFTDKYNNEYIFDSRKSFENFCKNKYGKVIDAKHYNSMVNGEIYYSKYKNLQNIFGNCKLNKIN